MKDAIQEQLIAARQNQILEAATKIFAEKGFHPTTTKDIARAAGVAEGTIYNYFENKTALLIGILDRMTTAARQDVDFGQVAETDFRAFMKAYFRHPLMSLKADNFELFRVVVSEIMVNKELRTLYQQKILEPTIEIAEMHFQQWAAQQVIKPIDISLAMRVMSGLVLGLIVENIIGDKVLEEKWDELPDFLANIILDGIGSDKL